MIDLMIDHHNSGELQQPVGKRNEITQYQTCNEILLNLLILGKLIWTKKKVIYRYIYN